MIKFVMSNNTKDTSRKTSSLQRPPSEQTLRCPRCDSANTKFCYYNNYNLTQPRYYCKTCRRYWTKGGALRNIPIGGGCRKNKKTKSCSSNSKFGDSSSAHVMDYPPRVINNRSVVSSYCHNNVVSFMNLDPLGFTFPRENIIQTAGCMQPNIIQEMGFTTSTNLDDNNNNNNNNTSLTCLQSLTCFNQDLAMQLFGGENSNQKESGLQPILFQNLENSRKEVSSSSGGGGVGGLATEWFFDDHYAPMNMNPASAGGNDDQNIGNISNWNNGIQGWNNLNHYNAIP